MHARMRLERCVSATTIIGLVVACASPRESPQRKPDTLVVVAPAQPGLMTTPPADSISRDTAGMKLDAFVGVSAAARYLGALPQLAFVAADGRRSGYDPATRRGVLQLPGASYDSAFVLADDDRPSSGNEPPTVESISVQATVEPSEPYTLVVMARDSGTFLLNVSASKKSGATIGTNEMPAVSMRKGQVRRYAVRVEAATLDVREMP